MRGGIGCHGLHRAQHAPLSKRVNSQRRGAAGRFLADHRSSAELRLNATWSLLAKFDGEFASNSQTYAGTGTLRASW
jgi:hypothetical protein